MPRLDVLRADEPDGYRSGFWGIVRIGPPPAPVELALRARLEGGAGPRRRSARSRSRDARRAACAGDGRSSPSAWRPTTRRSTCSAASSTRSAPRPTGLGVRDQRRRLRARALRRDRGGDRRRRALRASRARRAGSASTATSSARWRSRPPAPHFVALADQDDDWHPDKLATLLGAIGGAQLVYSDARIVDARRPVLAETYWGRRAQQPPRPALAAGRQHGDGRRVAVPPRAARRRAAVPARRSSRTSTTTGSRSARSRSATSPTSTGRSTTTSSTARRRSATPRRTG